MKDPVPLLPYTRFSTHQHSATNGPPLACQLLRSSRPLGSDAYPKDPGAFLGFQSDGAGRNPLPGRPDHIARALANHGFETVFESYLALAINRRDSGDMGE